MDYSKLRKHPRVNVDFTVKCAVFGSDVPPRWNDFKIVKVADISAGGMRLNMPDSIDMGSQLLILFSVPELSGALTGRVVRTLDRGDGTYDVGVLFVMLETQRLVYKRLVKYINDLMGETVSLGVTSTKLDGDVPC